MSATQATQFMVRAPHGVESGPFVRQQLREMYERGALSPDHHLRRTTDERWFKVKNVSGLFDDLEPGLYVPPEEVAVHPPTPHAATSSAKSPARPTPPPPPAPRVEQVRSSVATPSASDANSRQRQSAPVDAVPEATSQSGVWIRNDEFKALLESSKEIAGRPVTERRQALQRAIERARSVGLSAPEPGSTPLLITWSSDEVCEIGVARIEPVPDFLRLNRFKPYFWSGFWTFALLGIIGALVGGSVRRDMLSKEPYAKKFGLVHWDRMGWHTVMAFLAWLTGCSVGMVVGVLLVAAFVLTTSGRGGARDVGFLLAVCLFSAVLIGVVVALRVIAVQMTFGSPRTLARVQCGS